MHTVSCIRYATFSNMLAIKNILYTPVILTQELYNLITRINKLYFKIGMFGQIILSIHGNEIPSTNKIRANRYRR